MAKKNTTQQKDSKQKLELAQRIAENSEKVANTYATFENTIILIFRRITGVLNKVIFDSKFSLLLSSTSPSTAITAPTSTYHRPPRSRVFLYRSSTTARSMRFQVFQKRPMLSSWVT